jgi:broad specificity phosphatase PhoE
LFGSNIIIDSSGETISNIKKILQGQQGGELTENGMKQAKLVALRLRDVHFDEIISSDLNRAKQTSEQIMEYHQNNTIVYEPRIRERNCGELEGKSTSLTEQIAKVKIKIIFSTE